MRFKELVNQTKLTEGLKPKKDLFTALDEYFKTDQYTAKGLKAPGVSDETYGRKSMIYIASKDNAARKQLEVFLSDKGFTVNRDYHPGSKVAEVQVSYYKGYNWDE